MNSFTEQGRESRNSEYKENLEILRNLAIFSGLDLEPLKVLAYLCRRENFRQGDFVIDQGEISECFYYILSGTVQVIRKNNSASMVLSELAEGDSVGVLALLGGMRNLFSVRAATAVSCIALDRERFQKIHQQFPEITRRMYEAIIKRLVLWQEAFLQEMAEEWSLREKKIGFTLV
jgi:CRP/FNR family transcriptional regulator, cyclic AMP receptor protein